MFTLIKYTPSIIDGRRLEYEHSSLDVETFDDMYKLVEAVAKMKFNDYLNDDENEYQILICGKSYKDFPYFDSELLDLDINDELKELVDSHNSKIKEDALRKKEEEAEKLLYESLRLKYGATDERPI